MTLGQQLNTSVRSLCVRQLDFIRQDAVGSQKSVKKH